MEDASSPGPRALVAPPEYARAAREGAALVLPRLSRTARKVLDRAQDEARREEDNHVGTEHVVLGLMAVPDCEAARALSDLGITREVFVAQRHEEEGPSPAGRIPRTPRANRILVVAAQIAGGERPVCTAHVLLGVIAESEEWERSGRAGVHHLHDAALAAGTTPAALREAALARVASSAASELAD